MASSSRGAVFGVLDFHRPGLFERPNCLRGTQLFAMRPLIQLTKGPSVNAQGSLWALCGHKPIYLLLSFQLILAARQVWCAPRAEAKMIQENHYLHFI